MAGAELVPEVAPGELTWSCADVTGTVTTEGDFAQLLRQVRLRAALSQQQLADRIGTTQSAIARLEAGTAQPRLATLSKLAAALGEDLHVVVQGRPTW